MRQMAFVLLLLLLAPSLQADADILLGDGWEAFRNITYRGGDATQTKRLKGMLVLTAETIALHPCRNNQCAPDRTDRPFTDPPYFIVPLRQITGLTNTARVKAASAGERIMLGALASDTNEQFVGFSYEAETHAEAPLFQTPLAVAGAIEAKLRFRLKQLGVILE